MPSGLPERLERQRRAEKDDPRPGGDGGRRERLRGGRADPTQRSRGGATAEGLPHCLIRTSASDRHRSDHTSMSR